MTTYSTPGVWVEEIPTLAPSVAQVATAVPAFIGYTEKGFKEGGTVARIDTLTDYVNTFGGAPPSEFTATIKGGELVGVKRITKDANKDVQFLLYYGLSLYFRNGGGTCYIVSIGDYKATPTKDHFIKIGLELLEKEDEPTLIVLPDAVNLSNLDYYDLAQQALMQCHKLGDRFLILDVPPDIKDAKKDIIASFRSGIGTRYLNYAAAYHPYLQTTLNYQYKDENIQVCGTPPIPQWTSSANGITVTNLDDKTAKVKVLLEKGASTCKFSKVDGEPILVITLPNTSHTGKVVVEEWNSWPERPANFSILKNGDGSAAITQSPSRWSSGAKGINVIYFGNEQAIVKFYRSEAASTGFAINKAAELTITLAANAQVWWDVFKAWDSLPSKPPGFDISLNDDGCEKIILPPSTWTSGINGITVSNSVIDKAKVRIQLSTANPTATAFKVETDTLTITLKDGNQKGSEVLAAWTAATAPKGNFQIAINGSGSDIISALTNPDTVEMPHTVSLAVQPVPLQLQTLKAIQTTDTGLYNLIKAELGNQRVVLPPSPAIAGIYVQVDRDRGVWKAPANVSVASVLGPVTKISDVQQETLNVDPTGGKSINIIRAFAGKGTLVWGARTLEGNSNEWRYVPVRRLFITIEESTRKASSFAVFEPNDAMTWLKVKSMIDSYLYGLWEQGALAGSRQEQAYFINVGLGKTMTAQDILEGRMIVEIGVAAVRPAEFIILRFSHKMQEA